ncbi:hypothetical protein M6D81_31255 [Paenibacillus sp. J5C_2022]|uniref:hypothetical protein n=1 Tax=Paenibacillus sp. J5C2022 TaxID=2977129 RepID=UPI0021CFEEA0|nr:hypothetical protein [Paenibacillus sp. J5C2022]MCU6713185.1 hypothetical protein [Paenibacillus sp. J5C2022]
MKQIKVIFSFIFIIIGICIIAISKIAEEVVPNNGYFNVDLTLNYCIGAITILGGSIYIIKNSRFWDHYIDEVKARQREFDEQQKNNQ